MRLLIFTLLSTVFAAPALGLPIVINQKTYVRGDVVDPRGKNLESLGNGVYKSSVGLLQQDGDKTYELIERERFKEMCKNLSSMHSAGKSHDNNTNYNQVRRSGDKRNLRKR